MPKIAEEFIRPTVDKLATRTQMLSNAILEDDPSGVKEAFDDLTPHEAALITVNFTSQAIDHYGNDMGLKIASMFMSQLQYLIEKDLL